MIAELLFVFMIPLVWGFYELRQLRKPSPVPRETTTVDKTHDPDDTSQPPSTHQQEEEERCRDRTTEGPRR